jgi:hypothetical protein
VFREVSSNLGEERSKEFEIKGNHRISTQNSAKFDQNHVVLVCLGQFSRFHVIWLSTLHTRFSSVGTGNRTVLKVSMFEQSRPEGNSTKTKTEIVCGPSECSAPEEFSKSVLDFLFDHA